MDYNNDSTTTLADVHRLFREALARMNGSTDQPMPNAPLCPSVSSPAITAADISIVERAREMLGSPDQWNRNDTQKCPSGAKTFSIFCALRKASEEVLGEFE